MDGLRNIHIDIMNQVKLYPYGFTCVRNQENELIGILGNIRKSFRELESKVLVNFL
jgi:hypothetical protein